MNLHVNLKKLPNSNGKTSNINGEVSCYKTGLNVNHWVILLK